MKKSWTTLALGITLIAFSGSAFAAGTTAADFLNIGVSARQSALGGAGLALINDISSSYCNPSGLSFIDRPGVNFMHNIWYQDISYEFLGAALPLSEKSTIGVSAVYLHMGQIDAYDALDQLTGSLNPYSMAAIFSFSRKLSDNFSLGLSGKYIVEKLADNQTNGYAADLGAQYQTGDFAFGLAADNLGPSMKYESGNYKLPSSISAGIGYNIKALPISIMLGVKRPFADKTSLSTGIEYDLTNFLSLRGGYGGVGSASASGNINFGAGIKFMGGAVDYAFNPGHDLGPTHVFSFTFNFGKPRQVFSSNEKIGQKPLPANTTAAAGLTESPKTRTSYVVSAGKFGSASSAKTQIQMFRKLGFESRAEIQNNGEFKVILARTGNLDKAQKIHKNANAKGLACSLDIE
jgi:long-subunit fatty acid transport protein